MPKRTRDTSGPSVPEKLALAEKVLGHDFADRELLRRALTHPSAGDVHDPSSYYERLEFLGDSVIGFVISCEIFRRYPEMPEGGLTRIKASVVAGTVMAEVAGALGLADALIIGDSEMGTGGRGLASALENAFEALTAALYLDAGLPKASDWILSTLGPLISEEAAQSLLNPKSALQERMQTHGHTPVYRVLGHEGPPHDRTFTVVVEVGGKELGEGIGRSKKEAEAAAAAAAIETLGE